MPVARSPAKWNEGESRTRRICVVLIVLALFAAGCALPPVPETTSGGSRSEIPDRAKLEARIAAYYQAAATGNGPAMWPYMLGSVASGQQKEFFSRTDLPRTPAQVKIDAIEETSVHSDIWRVKPDAMAHVSMSAFDPRQNVWRKLKGIDTWYYLNGQWYRGKGM